MGGEYCNNISLPISYDDLMTLYTTGFFTTTPLHTLHQEHLQVYLLFNTFSFTVAC